MAPYPPMAVGDARFDVMQRAGQSPDTPHERIAKPLAAHASTIKHTQVNP
jgi:hypothetical protein